MLRVLMTGFEELQINSIPCHGRSMKNVVVSMDFLEFPVMYTWTGGIIPRASSSKA
jgi:hypothetical protein